MPDPHGVSATVTTHRVRTDNTMETFPELQQQIESLMTNATNKYTTALLHWDRKTQRMRFIGPEDTKRFFDRQYIRNILSRTANDVGSLVYEGSLTVQSAEVGKPQKLEIAALRSQALRGHVSDLTQRYMKVQHDIKRGYWDREVYRPPFWPKDVMFISPNDRTKGRHLSVEDLKAVIKRFYKWLDAGNWEKICEERAQRAKAETDNATSADESDDDEIEHTSPDRKRPRRARSKTSAPKPDKSLSAAVDATPDEPSPPPVKLYPSGSSSGDESIYIEVLDDGDHLLQARLEEVGGAVVDGTDPTAQADARTAASEVAGPTPGGLDGLDGLDGPDVLNGRNGIGCLAGLDSRNGPMRRKNPDFRDGQVDPEGLDDPDGHTMLTLQPLNPQLVSEEVPEPNHIVDGTTTALNSESPVSSPIIESDGNRVMESSGDTASSLTPSTSRELREPQSVPTKLRPRLRHLLDLDAVPCLGIDNLKWIGGICVAGDHVIVSDTRNDRVRLFRKADPGGYREVSSLGRESPGINCFNGPEGSCPGHDGATVYVSDCYNHAVKVLTIAQDGGRQLRVSRSLVGGDHVEFITDVCTVGDSGGGDGAGGGGGGDSGGGGGGHILVASQNGVHKMDAATGDVIATLPRPRGWRPRPIALAARDGLVVVAHRDCSDLLVYTPPYARGDVHTVEHLQRPGAVVLDRHHNIYIADFSRRVTRVNLGAGSTTVYNIPYRYGRPISLTLDGDHLLITTDKMVIRADPKRSDDRQKKLGLGGSLDFYSQ